MSEPEMIPMFGVSPQVFTQKIEPEKRKEFSIFFSSLFNLIQNSSRSSLMLEIKAENPVTVSSNLIQRNIDQSMQPNYYFLISLLRAIF